MAQQGLVSLIKTNIGMLVEVMDSVWLIVKQNLNVITSLFGTILSMILNGGQAVVTFLVDAVNSLINKYNKKILHLLFLCSRLFF